MIILCQRWFRIQIQLNHTWNVRAEQTITDIVIYNLFGQRILSITPNMSDASLNMSEFKSGIYLAACNFG